MGCGSSKTPLLKLVILGISGSGKSTFSKQMKHINIGTWEEQEILYYKSVIHRNIFIGLRELVKLAERQGIGFHDSNLEYVEFLNDLSANIYDEPVSSENKDWIVALWEDEGMKEAWDQSKYFQIQMTNLEHLMENIDRYAEDDYFPSYEDIFYARQRTTGKNTVKFEYKDYEWEIVDVGGQMPERVKWEQIIRDGQTAAILFFTALDEYNVISSEDPKETKFNISCGVWDQVIESYESKCLILFLNKTDIFQEKIQDKKHWKSFRKTFPDYKGKQDWEDCAEHIQLIFEERLPEDATLFAHLTCAIDTDKMTAVFDDFSQHILSMRLQGFGFM